MKRLIFLAGAGIIMLFLCVWSVNAQDKVIAEFHPQESDKVESMHEDLYLYCRVYQDYGYSKEHRKYIANTEMDFGYKDEYWKNKFLIDKQGERKDFGYSLMALVNWLSARNWEVVTFQRTSSMTNGTTGSTYEVYLLRLNIKYLSPEEREAFLQDMGL